MEDKKQQELMFRLSMHEQQIQQIQQQLQAIEQGILDMENLNIGLDELKNAKEREIFAAIGKGMFAKAKLSSEDLIIDVGNKNFIKKTIPESQKIVKKQIKKLGKIREELNQNLEKINEELTKTFMGFQNKGEKKA